MTEMSESNKKALMEKLERMSPEELREFQKKQCIFCQIATAKVRSRKVYEDEKVIAVLDINPASKGHVLVIPKEHYSILPQIPEEEINHLGIIAKRLSHAVLKGLKVQGTSIFIANGTAAGQRAQHFMLHIIPRNSKDGLLVIPQKQVGDAEISKVRESIQNKLNESLGIKKEVVVEKKHETKLEPLKQTHVDRIEQKPEKKQEKKAPKLEKKVKKQPEIKKGEAVSLDDIAGLFKHQNSAILGLIILGGILTVLKNHSHAKRRMVVFDKSKKVVIDSHLSHYLPKKYVELCIVTHCDIVVLKKRLEKRKYSQLKIRENLDAEIFQTCLTEAQEQRHTILEVDTTKTFDKKKLLTKVKAWIS